ncbi:MAG TPA: DinB family protein [Phycisphaerales bacterium]|nr:DinB family protein [Phycisphaerales bacterium]
MDRRTAIADGVLSTKPLLARYLKGFSDANHTAQAPGLPNHVAWQLGHLALVMQTIAKHFDGEPLAEADFVQGAAVNTPEKFGTETVCFASPAPVAGQVWPRFERCVQAYDAAVERLARCVRESEDARLDVMIPWGPTQIPLYMAAQRMVFHNGMHTGQLADLRRGLGMGSIFA